jgi:hypothetical protein
LKTRFILNAGLAWAFALCTAGHARADVAPPDSCPAGAVGQVCEHAGPNADQPGTCVAAKCERAAPPIACGGKGASGGAGGQGAAAQGGCGNGGGVIVYDCVRCVPSEDDESGCDCRVGPRLGERSLASLMLLLGFSALYASRRRGRRSAP